MQKIKCRYCEKELTYDCISDIPTFPFCSERCKLMDLGLWFDEKQRIEEPIIDNDGVDDIK